MLERNRMGIFSPSGNPSFVVTGKRDIKAAIEQERKRGISDDRLADYTVKVMEVKNKRIAYLEAELERTRTSYLMLLRRKSFWEWICQKWRMRWKRETGPVDVVFNPRNAGDGAKPQG
jgi:uncharacterized small protein (DUF1192 family)